MFVFSLNSSNVIAAVAVGENTTTVGVFKLVGLLLSAGTGSDRGDGINAERVDVPTSGLIGSAEREARGGFGGAGIEVVGCTTGCSAAFEGNGCGNS